MQENVKPACVNVGLIGANEVSDEVMRVVLQQSGCRISALWDHNANEVGDLFTECEVLQGRPSVSFFSWIAAHCDIGDESKL